MAVISKSITALVCVDLTSLSSGSSHFQEVRLHQPLTLQINTCLQIRKGRILDGHVMVLSAEQVPEFAWQVDEGIRVQPCQSGRAARCSRPVRVPGNRAAGHGLTSDRTISTTHPRMPPALPLSLSTVRCRKPTC